MASASTLASVARFLADATRDEKNAVPSEISDRKNVTKIENIFLTDLRLE